MQLKFLSGTHKLDGGRFFRTIPDRAFPIGEHERIRTPAGLDIHYFYDPPLEGTSHNKSVSGAITSDVSTCALVYKHELYDLKRSRQWTLDAPLFGIPFGAKHISIHIELSDDYPVRPQAYREALRYREGEQQQVRVQDFAHLVLEHRPGWLISVISKFAPNEPTDTNDIRDELQRLLNSLRVRSPTPKIVATGDIEVGPGSGNGMKPHREGEKGGSGNVPRLTLDDLLAVPSGAKRAAMSMNADRAPEITPLWEDEEIEEKGLKGRAARFYRDAGQLFVNMKYPAVELMSDQLQTEYANAPDPEFMRRMAQELSERAMMIRVGRGVVYALAKQLNHEWTHEDVARAQSPESLSLAADDFVDAMQNARRRMGQALRTGRQEPMETGVA